VGVDKSQEIYYRLGAALSHGKVVLA
jgi:hypothetical protein